MKWVPHNYQKEALSFLLTNPTSGLFLDPGLGKTSVSLSAIRILRDVGETNGVLLVAPLRVCYLFWPLEIIKWDNLNSITHTILHGKGKLSLWGPKKNIYIINPDGLKWLMIELLKGLEAGKRCPFDTLWIDESTLFKHPTSKTLFNVIKNMLPLFKRRHIMTGTPSPKSLMDLWSQIYILDKGVSLTMNFYKFRNKNFFKLENGFTWVPTKDASKSIHSAISHLILDMYEEDHLDMPSLTYNNICIELDSKSYKYYKEVEHEFFTVIDDNRITAQASAVAGMKCHQIAQGNIYVDIPEDLTDDEIKLFKKTRKTIHVHKNKIEALKELVNELNGKPLLVAYHYRHDLLALQKLFGANVPYIGGGVSEDDIKRIERHWNAGKLPILLGHPASMGHGLNFQESGNDICWFTLTWNLEHYIQLNKRIHRQLQ